MNRRTIPREQNTLNLNFLGTKTPIAQNLSHAPWKDATKIINRNSHWITTSTRTTAFLKKIKKIPCTVEGCDKSYQSKFLLDNHINTHNGITFPCTVEGCDKSYQSKKALDDYINRHEGPGFPCTVEGCDKNYQSEKKGLVTHPVLRTATHTHPTVSLVSSSLF
jgi:hypothetical protein